MSFHSDKAQKIRESLSMKQVAGYYGFIPDRSGFISCPFHAEKTSSCKVYEGNRGFSCFGCGKRGSVIDFVMNLFQINFNQALLRLNSDFNLNLMNKKPDLNAIREHKRQEREKQKYEFCMKLIREWWLLEFKKNYRIFTEQKPKEKFEELTDDFIEALCKLPYIEEVLMEKG
jgi:DNA primase